MTATVLRGDANRIPLADDTVDLIVSSPPYFALRSYQDSVECDRCRELREGYASRNMESWEVKRNLREAWPDYDAHVAAEHKPSHYAGQIGSEASPAAFVAALLEVTRECVRVLKPSGSLWINLGDKYDSGTNAGRANGGDRMGDGRQRQSWNTDKGGQERATIGRAKSLMGIPWRYAIACIDQLGLILRAEVIWSKPNGLPESVTDRVRRSHEQWFYFEQSGDGPVVPGSQGLPFCSLCGRPADPRASLVARLHELDASVEDAGLTHEVRADEGVQGECGGSAHEEREVGSGGSTVPLAVPVDGYGIEDAADLLDDGRVAAVDQHPQVGTLGASVAEGNGTLSVDDAGKPGKLCECVGHSLILNDEPWIPQSLAAEIAQLVADGEVNPQQAADFLSGDYARTHSTWFHFTLSPRYYSAVDEIREAHARTYTKRDYETLAERNKRRPETWLGGHTQVRDEAGPHPLGKLPGSVWTIPTEPLTVPDHLGIDHFAAFPLEWPLRLIRGWSPRGVCTACGEGRRPVVHKRYLSQPNGYDSTGRWGLKGQPEDTPLPTRLGDGVQASITGYACACPEPTAPTRPAVVLDPFGGTGTTALAAHALGRHGITLDMSADYSRLARWRCTDEREYAKALRVEKPAVQVDGQGSLLDLIGEA